MSNSNNNATLKDIFQIVGLVLIAIPVFFGLLFFFSGNIAFAAIGALVLMLTLYFIVNYLLVTLKQAKEDLTQNKIFEYISLILGFGSFAAIGFVIFAHFWDIELNQKEDIKSTMEAYINHTPEQYDAYYANGDNTTYVLEIANRYSAYLSAEGKSSTYIASALETLQANLLQDDLFQETREELSMDESSYLKEIENWNRFFMSKSIATLGNYESNYSDALSNLNKDAMSDVSEDIKEHGDCEPFDYASNPEDLPAINEPMKNLGAKVTIGSVVTYLILLLLTLFPYFIAERSQMGKRRVTIDVKEDDGTVTF